MSNAESSKTLSVIALALLVGYYLFEAPALLPAVGVLLFLAVFPNPLSRMLAQLWLCFSELLGRVNSKVILTLIYYLVLVPVAFLYRMRNRKTVDYFQARNQSTFFVDAPTSYRREIFEKTW